MPIKITKLNNVSATTKSAISRKSAQTLPNNPSEQGYTAEEIKRRFYQPILDAANSAIAEIDRLVNESNNAFKEVSDELDNFIDTAKIQEAYKVELDDSTWTLNEETGMYEIIIKQEQHNISDYKEIGVDMFLLDGDGKYTRVNQFEVQLDGTVRCFHESNSAGHISIYVKREGFIVGNMIVDADHVLGLAKVGRTNKYEDLDGRPNTEQMTANEIMISKIISGAQEVAKAAEATKATSANYAQTSGAASSSEKALMADKATTDQFGVNIHTGYAKQTGTYPNLKVGSATSAESSKNDEDGVNIKVNYAKQNGNYPNMSVGKATDAENATNAENATKATLDANGENIPSTYAKQTGSYPNMSVGEATKSSRAETLQGYTLTDEGVDIENAVANKLVSAKAIKEYLEEYFMKVTTGTVTSISSKVGSLSYAYLAKQGNKVSLTIVYNGTDYWETSVGDNTVFSVQLSSGFYSTSKVIVAPVATNVSGSYHAVITTSGVLSLYYKRSKNTAATSLTGATYNFEYLLG